ncbi:hypothetical protein N8512_00415 [Akkermansiaceae bacterium]|nr:hypothetical protein [Akkermansiaceae bacterium]
MATKYNLTVLFFINPSLIGGMASNARRTGLLVVERGGDIFYKKEVLKFLLKRAENKFVIIYATSNTKRLFLILIFRVLGIKVVTRVGGKRIFSSFHLTTKIVSLLSNIVVVVNQELSEFFKSLRINNSKLYHIPGFIPTSIKSICTEKFDVSLTYMYTDNDIYNLESVENIAGLGFSVLIGVYGLPVEKIPESTRERITRLSKLSNVKITENDNDYLRRAINATLHIRLTKEDGDSNVIRELLYHKKKVVASNVVRRPSGCLVHDLSEPICREKINEWLSLENDIPYQPVADQLEYLPRLFPDDF